MTSTLAFLSMPGGWEWILILLVALLLFGKRLPEVGRSVGKSIVEFKKGIAGIEDEIDAGVQRSSSPQKKLDDSRTVSQGLAGDAPVEAKHNAAAN